jgi:hypothetical protein
MIVPSSGAPKPVAGSKDSKKTAGVVQLGYKSSAMDSMALKNEAEKKRQLESLKLKLRSEEANLRAEENTYSTLRREIVQLESRSRGSVAMSARSTFDLKSFERQNAAQVARDEKEIEALEQEMEETGRAVESGRTTLIAQKEQEEKQDLMRIDQIKDEIKRKTLELKMAEDDDKKLRQEIAELKRQPKNAGLNMVSNHPGLKASEQQSAQKVSEGKARIEKLKNEILSLNQGLGTKKQQSEKTSNDSLENQKKLQEKVQEAKLAANRIAALDQEIKMIKNRIQALER